MNLFTHKNKLSHTTYNPLFLEKYKTGNVYLHLDSFYSEKNSSKITHIELYDTTIQQKIYDSDFQILEQYKSKLPLSYKHILISLWNSIIHFQSFYPLFLHLQNPNHHTFSVFITYYDDNAFSTREEISADCLYFCF